MVRQFSTCVMLVAFLLACPTTTTMAYATTVSTYSSTSSSTPSSSDWSRTAYSLHGAGGALVSRHLARSQVAIDKVRNELVEEGNRHNVMPTPSADMEPEPTPNFDLCVIPYMDRMIGCLCHMRFVGVLKPFDNKDRKKEYCELGFGKQLCDFGPFCEEFEVRGRLRIRRALRGLDEYAFNCADGASILLELPNHSKYRRLFE